VRGKHSSFLLLWLGGFALRRYSLFHPVLSRRMVQSASDWPLVSRTTQKNLTNKSCPLPVKKRKAPT